jgi:hypoxia-inducible factor (prolyl hydroxylase)
MQHQPLPPVTSDHSLETQATCGLDPAQFPSSFSSPYQNGDHAPSDPASGSSPAASTGIHVQSNNFIPFAPVRAVPDQPPDHRLDPDWLNKICQDVLHDMSSYGLCVIDNLFASFGLHVIRESLVNEVHALYQRNMLREGGVVNKKVTSIPVRGDRIVWVDEQFSSSIAFLLRTVDTIVWKCCNDPVSHVMRQYDIRTRTKAMVACYPGNEAHYVRHVDNPNRDGRIITSLYYLNKGWDAKKDGGLLRVYPAGTDKVANIEPVFDRLVLFWSDRRNPHEVMNAFSMRFAISVWYFSYQEREEELRRKPSASNKRDFPLLPFHSLQSVLSSD